MKHQEAAQLGFGGEIYRKLLHLLALGYPVGYLLIPDPWGLWVMVAMSVTALTADWLRSRHAASHAFIDRFFGFMMRERERDVLNQQAVFNGATWVTVSFTVLILLFPVDVAIAAFAVFMIGDAAAAIVGRTFGRTTWARDDATMEGSVAFLVCGGAMGWLLVSGLLPWPVVEIPVMAVLGAALVAMLLEAAPLPLNDNLITPLGAAVTIMGIITLWPS